ncbi:hypothetical protein GCM10023213_21930 [Prosthecobacter algae]|uniref:Tetratricopeptide repeat protein n=1 Tax=Prosthecobacter algae TaxID=1144682 RepID=A0ABP9P347_9BACT
MVSTVPVKSQAADVQKRPGNSAFKGLESKVAALIREFPRALAFRPPESTEDGQRYRYVEAAKPLFERFNLPTEGLYEAMRSYVLGRLLKKDLTGTELARFYFMIQRYSEVVDVALIAGEEAHHAKPRISANVAAALELAGYAALEQQKYVDAKQYFTVASLETDSETDLGAWTQIQTALAYTHFLLADYPAQLKTLREVMERYRLTLGPGHLETLRYHNELAAALYDQRQDAAAEAEYRKMLQSLEEKEDANSAALISVRKNLASVLESSKRCDEAEALLRQVLESQRSTLGKTHEDVMRTRFRLVDIVVEGKKFSDAEKEIRSLLEYIRLYLGPDHYHCLMGRRKLASLYYSTGRFAEAATQFQVLYEEEQKVLGVNDQESWKTYNDLGVCYNEMNQPDKAEAVFKKVLVWQLKNLQHDHLDTLVTRNNLGIAYEKQNKFELAEKQYLITHLARLRLLGPNHDLTRAASNNLTALMIKENDPEVVLQQYQDILQDLLKIHGPKGIETVTVRFNIALRLESLLRYEEAEKQYRIIYDIRLRIRGKTHPETMIAFRSLGANLLRQNRAVEAEAMLREGLPNVRENLKPDDVDLFHYHSTYARALSSTNKVEEAIALLTETLETLIKSKGESFPLVTNFKTQLNHCRQLQQAQVAAKLEKDKMIGGISAAAVLQRPPSSGGSLPINLPLNLPTVPVAPPPKGVPTTKP